jgi:radical SAM protein with 4Fe4S-binding SPASM domain
VNNQYYTIKKNINWRNEAGLLMLLSPISKKLFIYDENKIGEINKLGQIKPNKKSKLIINDLVKKELIISSKNIFFKVSNKKENISSPFNVTLQITDKCNLRCGHCHRNKNGSRIMSFDEFKKIIKDLRKNNVFNINISGGEPTTVKGLKRMIKFANKIGLKTTMSTNNVLMTPKLASELKKSGLNEVHISLDSYCSDKHDSIRGVKGAFETMKNNLINLKLEGIKFIFVTTLSSQSPIEYFKTIDLAYKLGGHGHKTNTLIPQGLGKKMAKSAKINNININEYIEIWKNKKNKYKDNMLLVAETMFQLQIGLNFDKNEDIPQQLKIGCPAGKLTMAINEKGDVLPCPFFSDYILGNIFKTEFKNILENEKLKALINRDKIDNCHKCQFIQVCGGCRARSFGVYQNIYKDDPNCYSKIYDDK